MPPGKAYQRLDFPKVCTISSLLLAGVKLDLGVLQSALPSGLSSYMHGLYVRMLGLGWG